MIVKTDPSMDVFEEKLSGKQFTIAEYKEALEELGEEGYMPKSLLSKRWAIPKFNVAVPIKVLADYDPQLEEADMIFLLKEKT